MPPVSQRYRDSRRRQIIDAARRCFASTGFHGTSMQDIFTESGLSAGAVYGHFTSKDDLVSAIIDEVLGEITAALDVLTHTEPPPPPHEVLGQMLQVLDHPPQGSGSELAQLAVQVWAQAAHRPQLNARLSDYYRQIRDRFTTLAQRYQHNGTLHPDVDPHHLAQVLTALGPAFLSQRALLDDVSADTFTHGLRALLTGPTRANLADSGHKAAQTAVSRDSDRGAPAVVMAEAGVEPAVPAQLVARASWKARTSGC